jgi:hypothetical protein
MLIEQKSKKYLLSGIWKEKVISLLKTYVTCVKDGDLKSILMKLEF